MVIPAYNEERRLPRTLATVVAHLRAIGRPFQVLVVDDGSADATAEVAGGSAPEVEVLRRPHAGKGAAVRAGMLAARGELTLVTDADLSTPITELAALQEALGRGCALAFGSRAVAGARVEVAQPLRRRLMGRTFNLVVRTMLLPGIHDTQCGVKLMRTEAARAVLPRCRVDGFAFDVELICVARHLGYRVAEVPVTWRDCRDSRMRPFRDALAMLRELAQIRRRLRQAQRPHRPADPEPHPSA